MKNYFLKHFKNYNQKLSNTINKIDLNLIYEAANEIETTNKKKKTIYVCGNGGSSAIASHYICDYFKGLGSQTNLKYISVFSLFTVIPSLIVAIFSLFLFNFGIYTNSNRCICFRNGRR